MKDLKVQFGSAQEVDFSDFLSKEDDFGMKMSDYVSIIQWNHPNQEHYREVIDWAYNQLWEFAIQFCKKLLKGWGGREQSAYATEFFKRMGIYKLETFYEVLKDKVVQIRISPDVLKNSHSWLISHYYNGHIIFENYSRAVLCMHERQQERL